MPTYKAGVIGAGAMGAEIAQAITLAGIPVVMKDISPEAVETGIKVIRKIYQSRIEKGKMPASELEPRMALVTGTTSYDALKEVDIVIEAVFENIELKKKVFKELNQVCPSNTILASNTSALSISELATSSNRPDKVIGLHFFFPAHVMKLVEVIVGLSTSNETINESIAFAERLGKIPVKVNDVAGFLVNRLLMPYLNEAAYCLQEEAATLQEIDQTMINFGFPMGPFALVDMVGLDICAEVIQILADSYPERMQPAQMWTTLYKKGRYGTKKNAGFYIYDDNKQIHDHHDIVLEEIIDQIQKETGIKKTKFSLERLIMRMINEAVLCLEESVCKESDIDIAVRAGLAFPEDKGGILHYADSLGIDLVLNTLENLYKELGHRFWPAPMLKGMVCAGYLGKKSGKGFFEYTVKKSASTSFSTSTGGILKRVK